MAVKKQRTEGAKRKPRPEGQPCTFSFREMPADVYKIILKQQGNIKASRGSSQYSMEQTIYHIIRDWQKCRGGKDIEA
jgi:hypothetical protein